jgi:pimeloyl-ACP methyl ester carboxylesterase
MSKEFILKTSRNNILKISAFGSDNINRSPCIILVHGFKGFKDWGFWPNLGEFFAGKGYFVLSFNFSHNGIGENLLEFTNLDKFAENTFSLEISELSELIDAYLNNYFGVTENKKIGLIGHSRGGAVSILTSLVNKNISALALWASVAVLDRYSERQKEKWRKKGVFEVLNSRTKQVMSLNVSLLEDIEKNKDNSLNVEKAVTLFQKPLLVVQGDQDLAVKVKEAKLLYKWADKSKSELFIIPGTGHTFGMQHPDTGSNSKFDALLDKTLLFFNNNLLQ